jgi:hypothetical protein
MIPSRVEHADVLDLLRFVATFVSTDMVTPADPSQVYLLVRDGRGSVASYGFGTASITRSGVGAYYFEQIASFSGEWTFTWVGIGGAQAAETFKILIDATDILG